MTKVSPLTPSHDASSASGLSAWLMPRRAHGKPVYGQEPMNCSRAVHAAATSAGSSVTRAQDVGRRRGNHRYDSVIAMAPAALRTVSTPARANQGTGPRYRVIHAMCSK